MPWNARTKARVLLKIRFLKMNETPPDEILKKPRPLLADKKDVAAIGQIINMPKWRREYKHIRYLKRILREIPFFKQRKGELTKATFSKLFERLKHHVFLPNETIIRYGEEGDRFYILIKGNALVLFPNEEDCGVFMEKRKEGEENRESRSHLKKLEEKSQGCSSFEVDGKFLRGKESQGTIISNRNSLYGQKAKVKHKHVVDLQANADLIIEKFKGKAEIDENASLDGKLKPKISEEMERKEQKKQEVFLRKANFTEKFLPVSGKPSKGQSKSQRGSNRFLSSEKLSHFSISEISDESTRKRKNSHEISIVDFTAFQEDKTPNPEPKSPSSDENVSVVEQAMRKIPFENQKMKEVYGRDFYIGRKIGAGDCFGELALIHSVPRSATVLCSTRCEVLSISKEIFKEILGENERQLLQMKIDFIKSVAIFEDWASFCISELLNHMVIRDVPRGTRLFSERELADQIFIVSRGEVGLTKTITLSKQLYKLMKYEELYTPELYFQLMVAPLEKTSVEEVGVELFSMAKQIRGSFRNDASGFMTKEVSICNISRGQVVGDQDALAYLFGKSSKYYNDATVLSEFATVFVLPVFRLKRFMRDQPYLRMFNENFPMREEWRRKRLVTIVDSFCSQAWERPDQAQLARLTLDPISKKSQNGQKPTKRDRMDSFVLGGATPSPKKLRKEKNLLWAKTKENQVSQSTNKEVASAADSFPLVSAQKNESPKKEMKANGKASKGKLNGSGDALDKNEKNGSLFLVSPEMVRSGDDQFYISLLDKQFAELKSQSGKEQKEDGVLKGTIGIEQALSPRYRAHGHLIAMKAKANAMAGKHLRENIKKPQSKKEKGKVSNEKSVKKALESSEHDSDEKHCLREALSSNPKLLDFYMDIQENDKKTKFPSYLYKNEPVFSHKTPSTFDQREISESGMDKYEGEVDVLLIQSNGGLQIQPSCPFEMVTPFGSQSCFKRTKTGKQMEKTFSVFHKVDSVYDDKEVLGLQRNNKLLLGLFHRTESQERQMFASARQKTVTGSSEVSLRWTKPRNEQQGWLGKTAKSDRIRNGFTRGVSEKPKENWTDIREFNEEVKTEGKYDKEIQRVGTEEAGARKEETEKGNGYNLSQMRLLQQIGFSVWKGPSLGQNAKQKSSPSKLAEKKAPKGEPRSKKFFTKKRLLTTQNSSSLIPRSTALKLLSKTETSETVPLENQKREAGLTVNAKNTSFRSSFNQKLGGITRDAILIDKKQRGRLATMESGLGHSMNSDPYFLQRTKSTFSHKKKPDLKEKRQRMVNIRQPLNPFPI